jgi:hypothetical protein
MENQFLQLEKMFSFSEIMIVTCAAEEMPRTRMTLKQMPVWQLLLLETRIV